VARAHSVRDAFDAGARAYRLGRGGAEYKLRLAGSDPGVRTLIAGRPAVLRGVRLGVAAARRGPKPVRRALYRRYGV
jgi:hypothetical protein